LTNAIEYIEYKESVMLEIKKPRMKFTSLSYIGIHNPMLAHINLYPPQYAYAYALIPYASSISYEILYAKYGEIHNLYRGPEIRRNLKRNI